MFSGLLYHKGYKGTVRLRARYIRKSLERSQEQGLRLLWSWGATLLSCRCVHQPGNTKPHTFWIFMETLPCRRN